MNCGSCHYTDGCCYTSLPPQVKCTITNKFHYYDDICDCEAARAAREADAADDYIKYSGDQFVLPDDILNNTPDSIKITAPSFPGITELGRSNTTWNDTIVYLGRTTSPFSARKGVQSSNLFTLRPLWNPKTSNTLKGASTVRQLIFILPVCLMT